MVPNTVTDAANRCKEVLSIHKPKNVKEVQEIVLAARKSNTSLYPVSTGFNWGYGGDSPVSENCELVDLSNMNCIRNAEKISIDNPVAVIEPGVTQGQLYEFLQARVPELTFNVTGSGKGTSIIGNALDRGVGYIGPRKDDIFGLEVVTGEREGGLLYTGFRRLGEASPLAHVHPNGLGPIIDGLFSQGNFGIVTSACFRLIPRRPKEVAVSISLNKEGDLPHFINELGRLKREKLIASVTHIANRERSRSTLSFGIVSYLEKECGYSREVALKEADQAMNIVISGEWACLASITGNSGQVKAALKEIRFRTSNLGRLKVISNELLDFAYAVTHYLRFLPFARTYAATISAMRPLHKLALGVPTDIAIENLLWKFDQLDIGVDRFGESRCGLLFVNPALPLDGQMTTAIIEGMKSIAEKYNYELNITINVETESSLVAVVNILFDRSISADVERAYKCADAMLEYIHCNGLEVYRARTDMMEKITNSNSSYWRRVYSFKKVLDPDNIMSPGRYNLL